MVARGQPNAFAEVALTVHSLTYSADNSASVMHRKCQRLLQMLGLPLHHVSAQAVACMSFVCRG